VTYSTAHIVRRAPGESGLYPASTSKPHSRAHASEIHPGSARSRDAFRTRCTRNVCSRTAILIAVGAYRRGSDRAFDLGGGDQWPKILDFLRRDMESPSESSEVMRICSNS